MLSDNAGGGGEIIREDCELKQVWTQIKDKVQDCRGIHGRRQWGQRVVPPLDFHT